MSLVVGNSKIVDAYEGSKGASESGSTNKANTEIKKNITDTDIKPAQDTIKAVEAEFKKNSNIVTLKQMLSKARERTTNTSIELSIPSREALAKFAKSQKVSSKAFNNAYNNMLECARACDRTSSAFNKLHIADFQNNNFLSKENEGDPAFKTLSAYTETQNNLAASIGKFLQVTHSNRAELVDLMQSAQYRVTEALNCVVIAQTHARLQADPMLQPTKNGNILKNASNIGESTPVWLATQELGKEMHLNNVIFQDLEQKASNYFEELGQLQDSKETLPHDDFIKKCTALQVAACMVKEKIRTMTTDNIAEMNADKKELRAEKAMFKPLYDTFDDIESRVRELSQTNARINVINAAKKMSSDFDLTLFRDDNLSQHMHGKVTELNTKCLAIKNSWDKLADPKIGIDEVNTTLLEGMKEIRDAIGPIENSLRQSDKAMPSLRSLAKTPHPTVAKHEEILISKMLKNTESSYAENANALYQVITGHKVNVSSMVEASLRNFPLEGFNLEVTDANLAPKTSLGSGVCNTVFTCNYENGDGTEQSFVFKPATQALRGYHICQLSALGIDYDSSVVNTNIASRIAAESIGCGSVIVKSYGALVEGEFGLLMDKVSGISPRGLKEGKENLTMPDNTSKSFQQYCDDLTPEQRNAFTANLMYELNKLEWADILSAQGDRHYDNYLLNINTQNNTVTITGIDNDASFNHSRIGINKIDISKMLSIPPSMANLQNKCLTGNVFDFENVSEKEEGFVISLGMKHAHKPQYIDKDVCAAILKLDKNDYRKKLEGYLAPDALRAAMLRFTETQKYAQHLQDTNQTVSDWSEIVNREHISRGFPLKNSYMVRDFGFLLPNLQKSK